jgi:lysophospholipase L1-like esterase
MVWKELIPNIEFLLRRHPPPKFVVIQLGSNDLGTVKGWPCVRFDLRLNWRENKRTSKGNKMFEGALNIV